MKIQHNSYSANQFEHSDTGNARRLVHRFGDEMRHCSEAGWLAWDGTRWIKDDGKLVKRKAIETVERIPDESFGLGLGSSEATLKHAKQSQSKARINAMVDLAAVAESISIQLDEFDARPDLLNLENGTLELHPDGRYVFREHRREDMLTSMASVQYNPDATCPEFLNDFLPWATHGNDDYIAFLQRALGYSIYGGVGEYLFILYGPGGNGKGTLTYVVQSLLDDYAQQAPEDLFRKKRRDNHPCLLARLKDVRFVVTSEMGGDDNLDEVNIKQLTGGDRIAARHLNQEYFEFKPSQKFFVSANELPRLNVTDAAMRRRLLVLPFTAEIEGGQDEKKKDRLISREGAGILNWILEGYRAYCEQGLNPPAVVREATEDYFLANNPVERFAHEVCRENAEAKVQVKTLHEQYCAWCEENDVHPLTMRRFNREFAKLGYHKRPSTGNATFWFGLSLS